jgi:hypothetical protein
MVEKTFGDKVSTVFVEKVPETPEADRVITQLVEDGCKMVFTTSFGFMDPTIRVAANYPNVIFEHCSGYKTVKNVGIYQTRFYEGAWLLGLIGGHMSKKATLGYVAPFPIPEVIRNLDAFVLGARSINPKITAKVVWINSWYDPPREKEAAQALIDQGCDVLYQNTDSTAIVQLALWPEGASVRQHGELGRLLRAQGARGAGEQVEVRGHQVGHEGGHGRGGQAQCRGAAQGGRAVRAEEGRDHRGQVPSLQRPDQGRQGGRQDRRRQDHHRGRTLEDELVRRRHRRQAALSGAFAGPSPGDMVHLRAAITASQEAVAEGNMPFGATWVSVDGMRSLVSRNNQITADDPTGHAEMVLCARSPRRMARPPCATRRSTRAGSRARCAAARCSGPA